jgi:hypothetical protein
MQPMRRASHKRTASVRTTSPTPSAQSPQVHSASIQVSTSRIGVAAAELDFGNPPVADDLPAAGVLISPDGLSVGADRIHAPDERAERYRQLAIAIRQRIESRLAGRVRDLAVRIQGDTIVLEGRCATYYTKQLAQHAALGVLNDEHLENEIAVTVPR